MSEEKKTDKASIKPKLEVEASVKPELEIKDSIKPELKIEPKVEEESERDAVRNFIAIYIDNNVRPNDLLFLSENGPSSIGLVCIEESERAGEAILKRIKSIVKEISLKLPNEKVSDIRWSIRTTKLKPDDDVNSFLGRLKGESA